MANKKKSLRNVSELCNDLKRSMRATLGIGLEYNRLANFNHRILAAHKREIADFQRRYDECVRKFNEADIERVRLREEIASLRSLIKELADALGKIDDMGDSYMCKFFISTKHCSKCKYLEKCQTGIAHNALKDNEREIAKAEVIG